ncbi:hypothetical protein [Bdellovibrio sp. HCB274]|uniref:hypothetical protein n=1 Tax=Bdellovibrio sp. HCB274 TaxID=3394361 RepID=UPI0039B45623
MKNRTRYLVVIAFAPVALMISSFVAIHLQPLIGPDSFLWIDATVFLIVEYLIWLATKYTSE